MEKRGGKKPRWDVLLLFLCLRAYDNERIKWWRIFAENNWTWWLGDCGKNWWPSGIFLLLLLLNNRFWTAPPLWKLNIPPYLNAFITLVIPVSDFRRRDEQKGSAKTIRWRQIKREFHNLPLPPNPPLQPPSCKELKCGSNFQKPPSPPQTELFFLCEIFERCPFCSSMGLKQKPLRR